MSFMKNPNPTSKPGFLEKMKKEEKAILGKLGLFWVSLGKFGQVWMSLGKIGQDWARLGKIGQDWASLGMFGQV